MVEVVARELELGGGYSFPQLEGSEKQVAWANDIRSEVMYTIDANLKHSQEQYKKFGYFTDRVQVDAYKQFKREFTKIFSETKSAKEIIDNRSRWNSRNIVEGIANAANIMDTQRLNGMKYDPKGVRMVKP